MTEYRYIGHDLPRPDGPAKASGQALYIHDLKRPGMLHGKIKFSEHAHARVLDVDTSRAERLPGVQAVLTAFNTPPVRFGFLGDNLALKGGPGDGKVRQFRDEVAAVAAIDPDTAAEAVSLIRVEYEPLAGVFDPEAALLEGAPLVHERGPDGRPRSGNLLDLTFRHCSGDLAGEERRARQVVEGVYRVPRIQQSCLGTAGCIAEFGADGNLTMWAKTQIPFLAQRDFNRALQALGLKGRNTRVIVPALGGGFGTGLDTHAYEYIAILLAHATGRPVRILYNRFEEFSYLSPRQSATVRMVQGLDEEGRLAFRRAEVLQDNGAYTSWGATYPSVMLLPATSLYRVRAVHFDSRIVYTNNTYCQAMRGYGNPELTWALESNLDELAERAGMDPLELRLRNANQPGETTPMGLKIGSCGLRECLVTAAERLGWRERRGQGRGRRRGVGLASLLHVGGSGRIYRSDASGVALRLDDYGNVYVRSGGVEMGQGLHTVLRQAVAESLGVKPEAVHVTETDTATCPWDVGTHASRGAFTALHAANLAVRKLRERIFALAEEVFPRELERRRGEGGPAALNVPSPGEVETLVRRDNFDLRDGVLFLKDRPGEPWARLDLGRFLRAIHFRERGEMLEAEGFYDPPTELPDWKRGIGNLSAAYAWGVQGAEVEVDEETGEIHILKLVAAHDVGKVLNPKTLEGQTLGGLAQGVGYALYEEVQSEAGRIRNPTFTDYKIPTIHEMAFPIELVFVETHEEAGPFGAKGVGEPGLVPTAPAIANAVQDAVGVRIRDLPLTPAKVREALRRRASGAGGEAGSGARGAEP